MVDVSTISFKNIFTEMNKRKKTNQKSLFDSKAQGA